MIDDFEKLVKTFVLTKRFFQVSTVLSMVWFLYWIAYEMIVWRKPFPDNITNVFGLAFSIVFFAVCSSTRFLPEIHKLLGKDIKKKDEIPKSWRKPAKDKPLLKTKRVIRVPMLKTFNRSVAAAMLIVNILVSQATLFFNPAFFFFFLVNSYIMLRYLWVTRGEQS